MRFDLIRQSVQRRQAADSAFDAYEDWLEECAAVHGAYRDWTGACVANAARAFDVYAQALDREERAASVYATVMKRVGRLLETGPAHELAEVPPSP